MAKKKEAAVESVKAEAPSETPAQALPLILTVSQVEALSPKEKDAFRHAGGTTVSDPQ